MIITKHALLRMQQRGIDENNVESAILNPDETSDSFGRRKLARKTIGLWRQSDFFSFGRNSIVET